MSYRKVSRALACSIATKNNQYWHDITAKGIKNRLNKRGNKMALPNTYRWIIVSDLLIRNDKRVGDKAPYFTLHEIIEAAKTRLQDKDEYREYGNKSQVMWCSEFNEDEDYFYFLVHVGNKNTSGVSFLNFDTRKSRDVEKEDNEGHHYSSHVLIKKEFGNCGNNIILIEKVPGIHVSALKSHLGWICRDDRFAKSYTDENGKTKKNHPIFEINGYQSSTIRDALKTGKLQDVEFVKHSESFEDGLDEDPIIKEIVHQAKFEVKKKLLRKRQKVFSVNYQMYLENSKPILIKHICLFASKHTQDK